MHIDSFIYYIFSYYLPVSTGEVVLCNKHSRKLSGHKAPPEGVCCQRWGRKGQWPALGTPPGEEHQVPAAAWEVPRVGGGLVDSSSACPPQVTVTSLWGHYFMGPEPLWASQASSAEPDRGWHKGRQLHPQGRLPGQQPLRLRAEQRPMALPPSRGRRATAETWESGTGPTASPAEQGPGQRPLQAP